MTYIIGNLWKHKFGTFVLIEFNTFTLRQASGWTRIICLGLLNFTLRIKIPIKSKWLSFYLHQ